MFQKSKRSAMKKTENGKQKNLIVAVRNRSIFKGEVII